MKRMMRKMCAGGDETVAEYEVGVTAPAKLDKIEEEFNQKLKEGWFAADITDQKNEIIQKFDPNADILLMPRMSGGGGV